MRKLFICLMLLYVATYAPADPTHKPLLGKQINWGNSLSQGLIGVWIYNEQAGHVVHDVTLQASDAKSWVGTPTWVPDGVSLDSASTDCVVVLAADNKMPAIGTGAYTAIIWANVSVLELDLWAFGSYNPVLYTNASSQLVLYDVANKTASTLTVTLNKMQQYAVVRRSTAANDSSYYIDGRFAGNFTHSDTVDISQVFTMGAGSPTGGFNIDGTIRQVLFWDRALTENEICQLYVDPYCIFDREDPSFFVAAAAAAPSGQVITIMMSSLPFALILVLVGSFVCFGKKAA